MRKFKIGKAFKQEFHAETFCAQEFQISMMSRTKRGRVCRITIKIAFAPIHIFTCERLSDLICVLSTALHKSCHLFMEQTLHNCFTCTLVDLCHDLFMDWIIRRIDVCQCWPIQFIHVNPFIDDSFVVWWMFRCSLKVRDPLLWWDSSRLHGLNNSS